MRDEACYQIHSRQLYCFYRTNSTKSLTLKWPCVSLPPTCVWWPPWCWIMNMYANKREEKGVKSVWVWMDASWGGNDNNDDVVPVWCMMESMELDRENIPPKVSLARSLQIRQEPVSCQTCRVRHDLTEIGRNNILCRTRNKTSKSFFESSSRDFLEI